MGKHDKEVLMDWNDDVSESYTTAEFQKLRSENKVLKARVSALEKAFNDLKDLAKKEVINRDKTIASKDRVIERLERKILSLVNDYV